MDFGGYDRARFVDLQMDEFDCLICSDIAKDPKECEQCGKIFCKNCIDDWIQKSPHKKCPNRCDASITGLKSKALLRMYLNLDIKCSNAQCEMIVKLEDIQTHEKHCLRPKCFNFIQCKSKINEDIPCQQPCCSETCYILDQMLNNFENNQKLYKLLNAMSGQGQIIPGRPQPILTWDPDRKGKGIQISQKNQFAFLDDSKFIFRTVLGTIGFSSGINYWEITVDNSTKKDFKVGVVAARQFDYNTAFSDYTFGYGLYSSGYLRNASDNNGIKFGKTFRKSGVLGVCLNMDQGTLSFALNGQYLGVAFQNEKLKSGTYYPALALLYCGGCSIKGGIIIPKYFFNENSSEQQSQ